MHQSNASVIGIEVQLFNLRSNMCKTAQRADGTLQDAGAHISTIVQIRSRDQNLKGFTCNTWWAPNKSQARLRFAKTYVRKLLIKTSLH